MPRSPQLLFALAVLTFSWLAMQVVHECGHVLGAVLTGGRVERVVLHPLSLSRTEVAPNPRPGVVVWLGPLVGVLGPLAAAGLIPRRWRLARGTALFFAGFCLVANGVYLGAGTIAGLGDGEVMRSTGTPRWVSVVWGVTATSGGIWIWHRLGSLGVWITRGEPLSWRVAAVAWVVTALLAGMMTLLGARP